MPHYDYHQDLHRRAKLHVLAQKALAQARKNVTSLIDKMVGNKEFWAFSGHFPNQKGSLKVFLTPPEFERTKEYSSENCADLTNIVAQSIPFPDMTLVNYEIVRGNRPCFVVNVVHKDNEQYRKIIERVLKEAKDDEERMRQCRA